MLTVDAANDCYACWKIYEALSGLQNNSPGLEIPQLIDYKEVWRRRIELLESRRSKLLTSLGRRVIRDGREIQYQIEMLLL
jgi:hypothetical protein